MPKLQVYVDDGKASCKGQDDQVWTQNILQKKVL